MQLEKGIRLGTVENAKQADITKESMFPAVVSAVPPSFPDREMKLHVLEQLNLSLARESFLKLFCSFKG